MKTSTDTTTTFEEQEVPILRKAMERAEGRAGASSSSSLSCGCPHTWPVLPHQLDLDFCRTTAVNVANPKKQAARIRNPIHAWHLQSQLTDFTVAADACPTLFGEEQERAMAIRSEGVMEIWHPLIHSPRNPLLVEKEEAAKKAMTAGTSIANTTPNTSTTTTTKPTQGGDSTAKPTPTTSTANVKSATATPTTAPAAPAPPAPTSAAVEEQSVPMEVEPTKSTATMTTTTTITTASATPATVTSEPQKATPMEVDPRSPATKDAPVVGGSSSSTNGAETLKKKDPSSTVAGTPAETTATTQEPTKPSTTTSNAPSLTTPQPTTGPNNDTVGTTTTPATATAAETTTTKETKVPSTTSEPPKSSTGETKPTEPTSSTFPSTTTEINSKKPDATKTADNKVKATETPPPSSSSKVEVKQADEKMTETKSNGTTEDNKPNDDVPDVEMKLEDKASETKSTDSPTEATKPANTGLADVQTKLAESPPESKIKDQSEVEATTTEPSPSKDEKADTDVEMTDSTEKPSETKSVEQTATGATSATANNEKPPSTEGVSTTKTEAPKTADKSTDGTTPGPSVDPTGPKTVEAKSTSNPPEVESKGPSATQTTSATTPETTKESASAPALVPSAAADTAAVKPTPSTDKSASTTVDSSSKAMGTDESTPAHKPNDSLGPNSTVAPVVDSSTKSFGGALQAKPMMPAPPLPLPTGMTTTSGTLPKSPTAGKNFLLSDSDFLHYQAQEEHIRNFARLVTGKRTLVTGSKTKKGAALLAKKRKLEQQSKSDLIDIPPLGTLTAEEERTYFTRMNEAGLQVQLWMEHFRLARKTYWRGQRAKLDDVSRTVRRPFGFFGAMERTNSAILSCGKCRATNCKLMQCLGCHFIGCAPNGKEVSSHMLEHMTLTRHHLGVTLGPAANLYCFDCDAFIRHEIFDQEMLRLDLNEKLPWLAWGDRPIARSFDAMRFINIPDVGIVWNGMVAAYPSTIPSYHLEGSQRCHRRWFSFAGELDYLANKSLPVALQEFGRLQSFFDEAQRFKIAKPVGMYNLGDTCFQSAVFQCLLNCTPVQNYFMNVGHNHLACPLYPKEMPHHALTEKQKQAAQVCLACELDKMFVNYYSSSIGFRVNEALSVIKSEKTGMALKQTQGEAIIASDMLAATWKCTDLSHLAGYGQNDAHEFLHGFLDVLQKHIKRYRTSVAAAVQKGVKGKPRRLSDDINAKAEPPDIIKRLFEGKLRSVLLCTECGEKRKQSESFLSISLPLSKEVHRTTEGRPGESTDGQGRVAKSKLSIERQLRHFTLPESLSDINCPACKKKTSTIKQHVVSKLPKILCLHLKRFDDKKKISDFVSFPLESLNMGGLLPQFCEVTNFTNSPGNTNGNEDATMMAEAELLYDLFGTVNHFGTLQSGHYVANVKVEDKWFHCNDAHVSEISEDDVLKSDAYLLFYSRR
eukprot:scaffold1803_cov92-Amphora_coffeaeformis.AAC.2